MGASSRESSFSRLRPRRPAKGRTKHMDIIVDLSDGSGQRTVPEEKGHSLIAQGRAVLVPRVIEHHEIVSQHYQIDMQAGEWRYEIVDDAGEDSLKIAIRVLEELRTLVAKGKPATLIARIQAGEFGTAETHNQIARWIHRIGFWVASPLVEGGEFQNCILPNTDSFVETSGKKPINHLRAERLSIICERLRSIWDDLPLSRQQADSGLGLVERPLRRWIERIYDSPPLEFGQAQDFPGAVALDPWSAYRKWQYYSDFSYIRSRACDWFPKNELLRNGREFSLKEARGRCSDSYAPRVEVDWHKWLTIGRALNQRTIFRTNDWANLSDSCIQGYRRDGSSSAMIEYFKWWLTAQFDAIETSAKRSRHLPWHWDCTFADSVPPFSIRLGDVRAVRFYLELLLANPSKNLGKAILNIDQTIFPVADDHPDFAGDSKTRKVRALLEALQGEDSKVFRSDAYRRTRQTRSPTGEETSSPSNNRNPGQHTETVPKRSEPLEKSRHSLAHSGDFRTVVWDGAKFVFTKNQARCVEILWGAWKSGAASIATATILAGAEIDSERFDAVFRNKKGA
ncbi:MAG: hypothetical protein JWN70_304, partial [Planctomycetaceae bacterium]|nr:hypothetical protein [Planctomycetaceae bacterium]